MVWLIISGLIFGDMKNLDWLNILLVVILNFYFKLKYIFFWCVFKKNDILYLVREKLVERWMCVDLISLF